jgi:hypothetical protein
MLAPGLLDSVLAIGRSGHAPARQGAAVLRRMRLQPAGHRDPEAAASCLHTRRRNFGGSCCAPTIFVSDQVFTPGIAGLRLFAGVCGILR